MISSLLQFPHTVPAAPISIGIKRQKPSVPTLEAFKKDAENRRHELLVERRRIDRLLQSEQNLIDQYEEEIRDHLDGDFDGDAA